MSATEPSGLPRRQNRTALASILAASVLVVLKLGTGLATGSLGLSSAGIESSGDVVAAVLTLLAIRLGSRPADEDHPYGHRRAENLAALGEAAVLLGGGIVIVVEAIGQLVDSSTTLDARWFVFVVIVVAMVIDASRISVSLRSARRYQSAALRGNAFHFAGDMAGSVAVLCGLLAVHFGFEQGDIVAALLVAAIIFAAAFRLIYENARVLMDTTPIDAQLRAEEAIDALGDEVELRRLRVRESGGRYFADAIIAVAPGQAIVEGHTTADRVEDAVRQALPGSDVVVHLEPRRDGLDLRDRVLAIALSEPLVREAHDIVIYRSGAQSSVSLHLKLPADTTLGDAHEVAERVEAQLAEQPGVDEVQTHLEPLEHPVAITGRQSGNDAERARIEALVALRVDTEGGQVELLDTDTGLVVFLTVELAADTSLTEAHELASRLEDDIRQDRATIADVVVHTEPVPADTAGPRH